MKVEEAKEVEGVKDGEAQLSKSLAGSIWSPHPNGPAIFNFKNMWQVTDGYEAEFCKHGRERNYGIFAAERKFGGMPEGLQETMHELQINNNIRVIGCQGQCET